MKRAKGQVPSSAVISVELEDILCRGNDNNAIDP